MKINGKEYEYIEAGADRASVCTDCAFNMKPTVGCELVHHRMNNLISYKEMIECHSDKEKAGKYVWKEV